MKEELGESRWRRGWRKRCGKKGDGREKVKGKSDDRRHKSKKKGDICYCRRSCFLNFDDIFFYFQNLKYYLISQEGIDMDFDSNG